MIRVNRRRVTAPRVLTEPDAAGARERQDAVAFYSDPANAASSFNFTVYRDFEIKETLARLFHNKCAYCESRYAATQPMDVEHWKPKASVILEDGREIRPGFFWLAADWENLFPSCIDCNRRRRQDNGNGPIQVLGKGNHFPVASIKAPMTITEVDAAQPLLLHPCIDEPGEHLVFLDEGVVRPALVQGVPSKKGTVSIHVFALNRVGLALARREHALLVLHRLNLVVTLSFILQATDDEAQRCLLEDLISHEFFALERAQLDDQPYAQLTRQIVRRVANSIGLQPPTHPLDAKHDKE